MDTYWQIIDKERSIVQKSYDSDTEIYDLAITAWEAGIVHNYFKDFHDQAVFTVMYRAQADAALMRAMTSVLKKEYAQAVYNIRLSAENLVIAIFAYAKPDELTAIFASDNRDNDDEKIKKAANKFLAQALPERSAKFKALHQMCDKFGSHQTLSHHSSHFGVDDAKKAFNVSLFGKDKQELNVGLTGIVVGLILEFHFAISALGEMGWLKVNPQAVEGMETIKKGLGDMKRKYAYLFFRTLM